MYYPKSQIITNLYTNGDKYAFQSTPNTPYTGYYYVVSTGEIFSGRNPNDGISQRLVNISTKYYPPTKRKTTIPRFIIRT